MLRSRILTSKAIAAWVALVIALAIPVSVLAQGMTLTLTAQAGTFTGKWVYRSFSISTNPKDTLAKLALGLNELNLTEQGGRIVGQRTGTGVSYDLEGNAQLRLFRLSDPVMERQRRSVRHHHGYRAAERSRRSEQRAADRIVRSNSRIEPR
jgi:hypothetical protein